MSTCWKVFSRSLRPRNRKPFRRLTRCICLSFTGLSAVKGRPVIAGRRTVIYHITDIAIEKFGTLQQ